MTRNTCGKTVAGILAGFIVCTGLLTSCGGGSSSSEPQVSTIQNNGSNTMASLAQMLAEAYREIDPTVSVEVSATGSGEGISNLINGTVDIANASRELEPTESAKAEANTGKKPVEHIVGYDAIAIYVHKENPVSVLCLDELAEIYGEKGKFNKWSDLGVDHRTRCPSDEIVLVSRMSNSGTYVYFREKVLHKKDFRLGARDMSNSKDVVDLVGKTPCAIGYSGMGFKDETVKFVDVSLDKGGPAFSPSIKTVHDGTYPLARPLYMYTLGEPTGPVKKYIEWILSPAGQEIVAKAGCVPIAEGRVLGK